MNPSNVAIQQVREQASDHNQDVVRHVSHSNHSNRSRGNAQARQEIARSNTNHPNRAAPSQPHPPVQAQQPGAPLADDELFNSNIFRENNENAPNDEDLDFDFESSDDHQRPNRENGRIL